MEVMMDKLIKEIELLKSYISAMSVDTKETKELIERVNQTLVQMDRYIDNSVIIEEQLRVNMKQCDFYQAAIEALPNPIFIKNEEGRFVYFNSEYQKYFGMEREQYLNKTVLELEFLKKDDRERYQAEDLELIQTGKVKHYESNFELSNQELGHSLYWSKGFTVERTKEKGLVGELVDISIQKRLQEKIAMNAKELETANSQIEKMMNQDCLTGLYNRRAMEESIKRIEMLVEQNDSHITILIADLDDFKLVNDTFGHAEGDKILVDFAEILIACNRKDDLVIRYGGEEFLVVLFDTKLRDARMIAERIRLRAEGQLILPSGRLNTVSIGGAELSGAERFQDTLLRADAALYSAKKGGKNRVILR